MNEKTIESGDQKISLALMASFVILTIQYFILIYFDLLETTDASRIQLISKGIVGLAYLYALPIVIKRSKIKLIGIYSLGVFVFLLHYLLFPENSFYMKGVIFPFFFMCLPALVYSMSIRNWNTLQNSMIKASLIVLIVGTVLGVLVLFGKATVGGYSMSLSYYMLLPMIIILNELFDNYSLKTLIFSLIALAIILSLGSRGPILCVMVFVLLKIMRPFTKLTYTKLLFFLTTFTATLFIVIYLDSILHYINDLLLNFGIRSRTIALFFREGVHLSGRENIYPKIVEAIQDNPLLGIGIAGDRLITGGYAHNLFLEVLASFGIIVGSALLIALLYLIIKNLLTKDKQKYNMIIIWVSLGFIPLIVSGSYLISMNFWLLTGLMIAGLVNSKNIMH